MDGAKYNCGTNTLYEEGYYLKYTFNDHLYELINIEKRRRMQQLREDNKPINESDLEFAIDVDFQNNEDYINRIKLMRKAIQTARTMRKGWLKNKSDYDDFQHDKELIGLKYENIKYKVNFIQISVIIVSTIITFLESIKDKVNISSSTFMIFTPIILSSYIGIVISISRFFKLDDLKEEIYKLDETMAFCMSGLRHRMRNIERMKPLTAELSLASIETYDQMLDDQNKDGLEETISSCKQKLDLAISLSEKVKYKNVLLKINLDKFIVEDNRKNIHKHGKNLSLYTYKTAVCCLWKLICCDYNLCKRHYMNVEKAYADAEAYEDKPNNYGNRIHKRRHKKTSAIMTKYVSDDSSEDDSHSQTKVGEVTTATLKGRYSPSQILKRGRSQPSMDVSEPSKEEENVNIEIV